MMSTVQHKTGPRASGVRSQKPAEYDFSEVRPVFVDGKRKWAFSDAYKVANLLGRDLVEYCESQRCRAVGSLRRRCAFVGDVEILYIGRVDEQPDPGSLFPEDRVSVDLAEVWIRSKLDEGVLAPRKDKAGGSAVGKVNKFLVHVESGIPVDLFAATEENWFNLLVCRTGSMQSNLRIAKRAKAMGLKWTPYGPGFITPRGAVRSTSEEFVFQTVGLPCPPPSERK
jgi:DNA polymerase/3'-5' exonuclease PolX